MGGGLLVGRHTVYQTLFGRLGLGPPRGVFLQFAQAVELALGGFLGGYVFEHLLVDLAAFHLHAPGRQVGVAAHRELVAAVDADVRHHLLAVLRHQRVDAARPLPATLEGVAAAFGTCCVHERHRVAVVAPYVQHRVCASFGHEGEAVSLSYGTYGHSRQHQGYYHPFHRSFYY